MSDKNIGAPSKAPSSDELSRAQLVEQHRRERAFRARWSFSLWALGFFLLGWDIAGWVCVGLFIFARKLVNFVEDRSSGGRC